MTKPATIGEQLRVGVRDLLSTSFSEMAKQAAREAVAEARAAGVSASVTPLHDAGKPSARANGGGLTFQQALDDLTSCIVELIKRERAHQKILTTLQEEVAEFAQRPTMRYCGVFDPQRTYYVGDFITDGGSVWHCDRACLGVRPGDMADVWTLAVKHGRDLRK